MSFPKIALLGLVPALFACTSPASVEREFERRTAKLVAECERHLEKYQEYIGQKYSDVEFPNDLDVEVFKPGTNPDGSVNVTPAILEYGKFSVTIDKNDVIQGMSCDQDQPAADDGI